MLIDSARACAGLLVLSISGFVSPCMAQSSPLESRTVTVHIDSGIVGFTQRSIGAGSPIPAPPSSKTDARVAFAEVIHIPDGQWMRVHFESVELSGSVLDGTGSFLRITSLQDGAYQVLDETSLAQWSNTSAYFNGNLLLVELLVHSSEKTATNRIVIREVLTNASDGGTTLSICDGVDLRELSNDPRDARTLPGGCTSWLFNERHYCLLTAGHCAASATSVVEFNVPLQASNGGWIFAHPNDQYAIDASSKQTLNNPCANDWSYFGAFPNSNTGLTMLQAQGASYPLASTVPAALNQDVRVRGYGTTTSPVPHSWNRAQKEHAGPLILSSGTTLRYRLDTTGGNSGSAIVDVESGVAIGIHTCGGCSISGGSNVGTTIDHPELQNALINPLGVCSWPAPVPTCAADLTGNGMVDISDLLTLLGTWGPCNECSADLNGDGVVNVSDLLLLMAAWGQCV